MLQPAAQQVLSILLHFTAYSLLCLYPGAHFPSRLVRISMLLQHSVKFWRHGAGNEVIHVSHRLICRMKGSALWGAGLCYATCLWTTISMGNVNKTIGRQLLFTYFKYRVHMLLVLVWCYHVNFNFRLFACASLQSEKETQAAPHLKSS